MTCDSIDAATKCMRASSYWSVAESMETDAVGNSIQDTVVDVRPDSKGSTTSPEFDADTIHKDCHHLIPDDSCLDRAIMCSSFCDFESLYLYLLSLFFCRTV